MDGPWSLMLLTFDLSVAFVPRPECPLWLVRERLFLWASGQCVNPMSGLPGHAWLLSIKTNIELLRRSFKTVNAAAKLGQAPLAA